MVQKESFTKNDPIYFPKYNKDPQRFRPCVGAWIVDGAGKLLVAQRLDNIGPYWQSPQGGIDLGEDPLTAIKRELFEEIGVNFEDFHLIDITKSWLDYTLPESLRHNLWKGRFLGQQQLWFLLRPRFAITSLDLSCHLQAEFLMWKWLSIDKLLPVIIPFKRKIYRNLVKLWHNDIKV